MKRWGLLFAVFIVSFMLISLSYADDCGSCHASPEVMAGFGKLKLVVDDAKFKNSVHGKVGIDCSSCHTDAKVPGKEGIAPHKVPLSKVNCGICHQDVVDTLSKSIHGEIGVSCSDCHGEVHSMLSSKEPGSATNPLKQPKTCGNCHAKEFETFAENFHFKRLLIGNEKSASCAECHGAHDIIAKGNPGSLMNEGSRYKMCIKCHGGVTEKFAAGFSHKSLKEKGIPYYAAVGLGLLTTFTFLFVMVHTLLDVVALIREKLTGGSH